MMAAWGTSAGPKDGNLSRVDVHGVTHVGLAHVLYADDGRIAYVHRGAVHRRKTPGAEDHPAGTCAAGIGRMLTTMGPF